MNLKDFVSSEKAYFKPILEKAELVSNEQLEAWRAETMLQRQERISLELYEQLEGKVQHGPFRGMKLL